MLTDNAFFFVYNLVTLAEQTTIKDCFVEEIFFGGLVKHNELRIFNIGICLGILIHTTTTIYTKNKYACMQLLSFVFLGLVYICSLRR